MALRPLPKLKVSHKGVVTGVMGSPVWPIAISFEPRAPLRDVIRMEIETEVCGCTVVWSGSGTVTGVPHSALTVEYQQLRGAGRERSALPLPMKRNLRSSCSFQP